MPLPVVYDSHIPDLGFGKTGEFAWISQALFDLFRGVACGDFTASQVRDITPSCNS